MLYEVITPVDDGSSALDGSPPDRNGRRKAARHDAVDQEKQIGRPDQELIQVKSGVCGAGGV